MHVIVFASQKGGVGKTTIAAHIAVAATTADLGPVVIMDTDPQASLAAWWNARQDNAPGFYNADLSRIADQLAELRAAGAGLVVIDTPPAMTNEIRRVVQIADLVVILTLPSPVDLRAIGNTVGLVQEAGRPFVFTINRVKPNVALTAEAARELSEHGPVTPFVGDRADFATAFIDGRTIQERSPKSKGADEVADLWRFVHRQLSTPTKR